MGTKIEWTEETWNPVTGCTKVSPGCAHCYAETVAERFWKTQYPRVFEADPNWPHRKEYGTFRPRCFADVQCHPERLKQPLRWRKPRRVFVNSMSDLFHESVPDEFIDQVFAVMALCPWHAFQVLTKRAERMKTYCSDPDVAARIARAADTMAVAREVAAQKEEIRPIPGYDGYYASNLGVVLSVKRGETNLMKPDAGEQGHQRVQLHRDGSGERGDRMLVHRLILETFVGPPPTPDAQGCHRDGDPSNNAVPNLRWGTQAENWDDRKRHGNAQSWSRLTLQDVEDIKGFRRAGMTQATVAAKFGISDTQVRNIERGLQWAEASEWPLRNCWLGVSVENQHFANGRIPLLLQTPAAIRFVSYEPALGLVDFNAIQTAGWQIDALSGVENYTGNLRRGIYPHLDWVIVGGESGPSARPCDRRWIYNVIQQCQQAGVAVFVKQLGTKSYIDMNGTFLPLIDRKGGDMSEWPADLRVREYPARMI